MNRSDTMRDAMIRAALHATGGRIFAVTFRKRSTGESRTLNARMAVHKGVTGKGMAYDPIAKGLVTVYDMQAGHHKTIPVDAISRIACGGTIYFQ